MCKIEILLIGLIYLIYNIIIWAEKKKNVESGVVSAKTQVEVKSSANKVEPAATGTKPVSTQEVLERLKGLKELLDSEAITEDEYAVLKQKELNKM